MNFAKILKTSFYNFFSKDWMRANSFDIKTPVQNLTTKIVILKSLYLWQNKPISRSTLKIIYFNFDLSIIWPFQLSNVRSLL